MFSFVSPEAAAAPVLAFERASDGAPVDPETYLSIKDDEIVVTATVAGAADGNIRFELAGTNGGAPYEFAFAVGGSPTTSAQVVPVASDGTAAVTLRSLEWWGVATVTATYEPADGSTGGTAQQEIPVDTDDDTIADAWELDDDNGGRARPHRCWDRTRRKLGRGCRAERECPWRAGR